jgi:hypothetical protein
MKKIIKLTENDIQKLVVKIIKEDVGDEFSWVNDLDVSRGEKQFKKSWRRIESEWSVDMDDTFELLVDNGITKLDVLNDIADELYNQFNVAWDLGRDYGSSNDCSCDGCCDDYIWYEDHREKVGDARQEGYDEGRDSRDGEVEDLEEEIADLQEKLNDRDTEVEEMGEEIADLKEKLSKLLTRRNIPQDENNES